MKYKGHSSYILDALDLTHESGVADIKEIFTFINLYESVHDTTMSGNVMLSDTVHLQDRAPLYGLNETISMTFYTSGNEKNPIEYTGVIYKVSERQRINEFTSGYLLHFCSKEIINSKRKMVQQKYEDTIESITSSVYDLIKTDKNLDSTGTKGVYKYVFGNTDPLEAIEMMIPKAVSGSGDHSYVFFENNQDFVFKPLQELYTQEPVASYKTQSAGIVTSIQTMYDEQFETFHDFQLQEENSALDRLNDGVHGSDHYTFDLISKEYMDSEDLTYNKDEWYNAGKSLGRESGKTVIGKEHDMTFLTFSNGEVDKLNHKDYVDSKMKFRESDILRAKATVMGDSKLKAGDVIFAYIPVWNQDTEQYPSTLDGNFLIKSIWHKLTQTEYLQTFNLAKDAYAERSV